MEFTEVVSSAIEAIGYDKMEQLLRIRFTGGREYDYPDVPADVVDEFIHADSIGKYYNKYIKAYSVA